jgi:hypothetical protein
MGYKNKNGTKNCRAMKEEGNGKRKQKVRLKKR